MTSSVDTQTRSLAQNKPLMCNYSLKQMTFWSTNARLYLRWSASLGIWFSLNRSGPPCWAANRQPISETCELENSYQRFVYTFCTDHRATDHRAAVHRRRVSLNKVHHRSSAKKQNKTTLKLNWCSYSKSRKYTEVRVKEKQVMQINISGSFYRELTEVCGCVFFFFMNLCVCVCIKKNSDSPVLM